MYTTQGISMSKNVPIESSYMSTGTIISTNYISLVLRHHFNVRGRPFLRTVFPNLHLVQIEGWVGGSVRICAKNRRPLI